MALESVTNLNDLVATNPVAGDPKSEGDDHIRNIKAALLVAFPDIDGRTWRTQAKSATYALAATDNMSLIHCTSGGPYDLTAAAAATLGNGFLCLLRNDSGGVVTINPNGAETVNGAATVAVCEDGCALIWSDGSNLQAMVVEPAPVLTFETSASGSSVDFTSIPAWARKITLTFNGISANAHDTLGVQIGDSGGIETSGYSQNSDNSAGSGANGSTWFILTGSSTFFSGGAYYGKFVLEMLDSAGTKWVSDGILGTPSFTSPFYETGVKELSARLDRVRVLLISGNSFDAGSITARYER